MSVATGRKRTTDGPGGLTPRELEILRFVASGLSYPAIGIRLDRSFETVKRVVTRIRTKVGAGNKVELVLWAERNLAEA